MWSIKGVRFKCPTCSESFVIQPKYLKIKKLVACNNCDYAIPHEVLENIKASVQHASNAFVHIRDNKIDGLEFDFIPVSDS